MSGLVSLRLGHLEMDLLLRAVRAYQPTQYPRELARLGLLDYLEAEADEMGWLDE